MLKEYLVQLSPFYQPEFLKEYGQIFYQADAFSNVIGVSSELDLIEVLKHDRRVKLVRGWNDLTFEI